MGKNNCVLEAVLKNSPHEGSCSAFLREIRVCIEEIGRIPIAIGRDLFTEVGRFNVESSKFKVDSLNVPIAIAKALSNRQD